MTLRFSAILAFGIALAGCTEPFGATNGGGFISELPQSVVDIAAPYQNLNAVKLLPEDGCFWYLHKGPVESTLLPLRTTKGAPICTQAQTEIANASS